MAKYVCVGYGKKVESDKIDKFFGVETGLSVIIPTFNEEGNVREVVREYREVISKTKFKGDYEIVIVDDDSQDRTPEIMDSLAKENDVVALHRYHERGIFSAFIDGLAVSTGKMTLTTGADLSQPPETLLTMLKFIDNYDVVSGSRYLRGGGMDCSFLRKVGSFWINKAGRLIMGVRSTDLTGVFHLVSREKINEIRYKYPALFGEFDFEFFYRAQKKGFTIKEVPFVYKSRESGSSKMKNSFKYSLYYLRRAFQLAREGRL